MNAVNNYRDNSKVEPQLRHYFCYFKLSEKLDLAPCAISG